jgi:hypothetical protein
MFVAGVRLTAMVSHLHSRAGRRRYESLRRKNQGMRLYADMTCISISDFIMWKLRFERRIHVVVVLNRNIEAVYRTRAGAASLVV